MSQEVKQEPIQGTPGHIVRMVIILLLCAGLIGFGLICLWWGGFWGIGSGIAWTIAAAGVGHQTGVGRGYRLAKPVKISMSGEGWE